jgi:hypothetical protein
LKHYSSNLSELIPAFTDTALNIQIPDRSKNFIEENLPKIFFKFDEQEIEGINQLIRLPYYHGMIEDIIEVKFV